MSLIIADEEFWRGAARIHDISDELLDIFTLYGKIVYELTQKGICDVAANNELSKKIATLRIYADLLPKISDRIVNETNKFISDIDEADSYLYD